MHLRAHLRCGLCITAGTTLSQEDTLVSPPSGHRWLMEQCARTSLSCLQIVLQIQGGKSCSEGISLSGTVRLGQVLAAMLGVFDVLSLGATSPTSSLRSSAAIQPEALLLSSGLCPSQNNSQRSWGSCLSPNYTTIPHASTSARESVLPVRGC